MNGYVYSLEEMVAVITPSCGNIKRNRRFSLAPMPAGRRMHNLTLICL